jgi:hypothetical protein
MKLPKCNKYRADKLWEVLIEHFLDEIGVRRYLENHDSIREETFETGVALTPSELSVSLLLREPSTSWDFPKPVSPPELIPL